MIFASLALFTLSVVVFLTYGCRSLLYRLFYLLCSFGFLLFSLSYLIIDQLTANGIDGSVLYHLSVDTEGAALGEFWRLIVISLIGLLSILGCTLYIYRASRVRQQQRGIAFLSFAPVLAAFIVSPASSDIYSLYQIQSETGAKTAPVEFREISSLPNSGESKNLIYIYLESLEDTYFNEKVFPGLLPNLQQLKQQGYSFDNIQQLDNTGWTIAGMVASQCGIPLMVAWADRNASNRTDSFLPDAVCLGNLLKEKGYALSYMGGASLKFAGKGQFYRDHGFEDIRGRDELEQYAEEGYQSRWGLYDDTLFSLLREKLLQNSNLNEPWALFSLTLDTHHPYGHMSDTCKSVKYLDGSNEILNAVHCADQLVGALVSWMRQNEILEQTTLILASDHLAMRNTAWEQLESQKRENFLLILDDDLGEGRSDKVGSTLDIGPTILDLLGFANDGLGFGRSLLKDDILYADEAHFESDMNLLLAQNSGFLRTLWAYPQLDQGIVLDQQNRSVILGNRELSLPLLLTLDSEWSVEQIILRADIGAAQSSVTRSNKKLYIGSCDGKTLRKTDLNYCATLFDGSMQNRSQHMLNDGDTLSLDALKSNTAVEAADNESNIRVVQSELFSGLGAVLGAASNAGSHGLLLNEVYVARPEKELIAFYGYDERGALTLLNQQNPCELDGPLSKFVDIANSQPKIYPGYILVKGGSQKCDSASFKRNISELFSGSRLNRWYEIEPQKGYLAAVELGGNSLEFISDAESSVEVQFKFGATHLRSEYYP